METLRGEVTHAKLVYAGGLSKIWKDFKDSSSAEPSSQFIGVSQLGLFVLALTKSKVASLLATWEESPCVVG